VRHREGVPLRHHADDGREAGSDLDAAADDARIAAEPVLPHPVAEQHDRRRARALVGRFEHAAVARARRRDAERRCGDLGGGDRLRAGVGTDEVRAGVAVRAEIGDGAKPAIPLVVVQHAVLVLLHLQIPALDLHDAIPVGERELRAVDDAEHVEGDGAEPDAERHGQPADDGQSRILHEHPDAELQVERHSAEPRGASPLPHLLLVPLDAAEGDERPPPRLDGIEAAVAHEARGLHLDVEAHLLLDPGLGGRTAEEAQAGAGGVEPRHGMLRDRARAARTPPAVTKRAARPRGRPSVAVDRTPYGRFLSMSRETVPGDAMFQRGGLGRLSGIGSVSRTAP
jgi:hypothetical protein